MLHKIASRPPRLWGAWLHFSHCRRLSTVEVLGRSYPKDKFTNITPSILSKLPTQLYTRPGHPLNTLKTTIEAHFPDYAHFSNLPALVSTYQNFDSLSFPADHPGRSATDSYYVNKDLMLRTHTSAHEVEVFCDGHKKWLLTADVYRRDEIDSSHYPVFHQMEGARLFSDDLNVSGDALARENTRLFSELSSEHVVLEDRTLVDSKNPYQEHHNKQLADLVTQNLKYTLSLLLFKLFAQAADPSSEAPLQIRWIPAYFPFTTPSYEVEVFFRHKWLEILGCGVIQQATLTNAKVSNEIGWAFGLGLERIAMILYKIPDIRLFWSEDLRFLSQFKPGEISTFQPYSRYPATERDISFWCPNDFHSNDFCDIVRDEAGDLAEEVQLIDQYHDKRKQGYVMSRCFRIRFRSMERSMEHAEINKIVITIKKRASEALRVEIR
ncbi:hypothetical protein EW145_g1496 [Phellinidium pouzarii]|uniref:Phenylalanine--tRNA ligase, mitochondrial n=1 Tax=Phellinidium pouzarii TaxID=167371 RepID=A0A4V3XDL4_9AGAM|nr:hypothetical protein EW145_g1496 [Phellinidium pouzarii]